MRRTLIIGATSAIAQATARLFSEAGDALYLVARNESRLEAVAADLRVRGAASVHTQTLDVLDYARHKEVVENSVSTLHGLDLVLIAHGTLPDQQACEESSELMGQAFAVNGLSTLSLLTHVANEFEQRRRGSIVVISSVAGDRGRQSNYVYGAAKSAVTVYLQGLRNRLSESGVQVLTVKPGFVDTPMTAGLEKNLLWATPEQVARAIVTGVAKNRDEIYAPWYWWAIMRVITSIPELVFKRLKL